MVGDIDLTNTTLIGDKGYYDGELRTHMDNRDGQLIVLDKKRHTKFNTQEDTQLLRQRSIVETVNAQLKNHPQLERTLALSSTWLYCAYLKYRLSVYVCAVL